MERFHVVKALLDLAQANNLEHRSAIFLSGSNSLFLHVFAQVFTQSILVCVCACVMSFSCRVCTIACFQIISMVIMNCMSFRSSSWTCFL